MALPPARETDHLTVQLASSAAMGRQKRKSEARNRPFPNPSCPLPQGNAPTSSLYPALCASS